MHGKVARIHKGPLVLFHLSDIHFCKQDPEAIAWVERRIAEDRPDAIILTGDLTMRARHREFAAACRWISSLDVPVTVEVGNHDLPYFNLWERFTDPYRRFRGIEKVVEAKLDLPNLAVIPLKTTVRAQWQRFPWANGLVTDKALDETLAAIDAQPPGTRVLVAAHHPLPERGPRGKRMTIHGDKAMTALAGRKVMGILTGHVHDPFDIVAQTPSGPLRMIGAGTLSQRIRSTPCSFNRLVIDGDTVSVEALNLDAVPTQSMQVDRIPEDALPPRTPGEPVSPVRTIPRKDPPVH